MNKYVFTNEACPCLRRCVSLRVPYARIMLFVLVLLGTVGCTQSNQPSPQGRVTRTPGTSKGTFQNPVITSDFADPSILHAGQSYYAYATNASGKNIQVARSRDMVHWELLNDAMPVLPVWAQPGGSYVWAPDVMQVGTTYVLYYTARDQQSNKQCVGAATSDKPEGKFRDRSDHPLVCQADEGGTIDPGALLDGGKLYLYFKNDGNCCGIATYLYVQQLSSDGLSVTGTPTRLMYNDKAWEGHVVEAPEMFKHNGAYYLFFSANDYAGVNYAVGYATCQSAIGPCQEAAENPILSSKMQQQPFVIGPGGEAIIQLGTQTWIVYHAWNMNSDGSRGDSRYMWLDRIDWQHDKPHIQGPTANSQSVPLLV